MDGAIRRNGAYRTLRRGGGRSGRLGLRLLVRLGIGLRLDLRLVAAAVAGQVALVLAVLLEVGLVPAAAGQPELRCRQLAADLALAALRALRRIGIGKLLQAVERVAAGG